MRNCIFLLLISIFSCSPQPKDCSNFRTGTFKFKDSNHEDWVITRSDSVQIESNLRTGSKIIGSIKWLSECRFILTYKEFINRPDKNDMIDTQIEVYIVKTNKNSYKYHAFNNSHELRGWLIKTD